MVGDLLELLRSDAYITVNKNLARKIGTTCAIFYSELLARYKFFKDENKLNDGYFYSTIETVMENTGLKKDEQESCIKNLINLGLIDKKLMKSKTDNAPRRYFRIKEDERLLLSLIRGENR